MDKQEQIFCNKCGEEINTKEDSWYRTTLFIGEEIDSEIFFHRQCYKDFHKDKFKEAFNEKMKGIKPMIQNIFGRRS